MRDKHTLLNIILNFFEITTFGVETLIRLVPKVNAEQTCVMSQMRTDEICTFSFEMYVKFSSIKIRMYQHKNTPQLFGMLVNSTSLQAKLEIYPIQGQKGENELKNEIKMHNFHCQFATTV